MPATPPLSGPYEFNPARSDIDGQQAEALVFIAQRLAGIEWILGELNLKATKVESSLALVAGKMK